MNERMNLISLSIKIRSIVKLIQNFSFSQDKVRGTGFALSSEIANKLGKIYETMIFIHQSQSQDSDP